MRRGRIAALPDVWRLHAGESRDAVGCQTDAVRLPSQKLNLISSLGEFALAVVGGRLAWSMLHRGVLLPSIITVTLSAVAVVLGFRYLREYRKLGAPEDADSGDVD